MKSPNIPQLLSAARLEFIETKSFSSPLMSELSELLQNIASNVYSSRYFWSEYNKRQWDKFISLDNSYEGGCVFSLEAYGDYDSSLGTKFKGLGIGGPVGKFPYHVWPIPSSFAAQLQATVTAMGYPVDLVG